MGAALSRLQLPEIFLLAPCGEATVLEATNVPDLEEKLRNCKFFSFFYFCCWGQGRSPRCFGAGDASVSKGRQRTEPRSFQHWRISRAAAGGTGAPEAAQAVCPRMPWPRQRRMSCRGRQQSSPPPRAAEHPSPAPARRGHGVKPRGWHQDSVCSSPE